MGCIFCLPVSATGQVERGEVATPVEMNEQAEQQGILYRNATDPTLDALGDPLPESAILRLGTKRFQHPSSAHSAALSPDGKTYITYGRGVAGWDTENGKQLWLAEDAPTNLSGSAYGQCLVVFSDSSDHFYTTGAAGSYVRWETRSGENKPFNVHTRLGGNGALANLLGGPSNLFTCIQVTRNADALYLGGAAGLTKVDVEGKEQWSHSNDTSGAAEEVDADGRSDRLWFGGHFTMLQLSPDERLVAAVLSQAPKSLQLFNADSGELVRDIQLTANLIRLTFSPDSLSITCSERDCGLRQYHVATGERLWEHVVTPAINAESYLTDLVYIPAPVPNTTSVNGIAHDDDLIAVGAAIGPDNVIYLVNATTGDAGAPLRGHSWKPWGLQFSPAKRVLYSTGWEGSIRLWDIDKAQQLPLPKGLHGSGVVGLAQSGEGLAHVDDMSNVHVISLANFRAQRSIAAKETSPGILRFSRDGKTLYAGGTTLDELQVVGWNLDAGTPSARGNLPKGRDPHSSIEALVISGDESVLGAAVFRQSKAYLSDLRSGEQIAELPHNQVYGMDLSPDQSLAVTVGWDKSIRVWSTADGSLLQQVLVSDIIKGDEADLRMYGVCFNGAGSQLATAHMGGRVSLWNVQAGNTPAGKDQEAGILQLSHHFECEWFTFGAIDFSRDGYWILTGSAGGNVSLYDAINGQRVWTAAAHDSHVFTVQLHPSNRMAVSGGSGEGYLWSLLAKDLPPFEFDTLYNDLLSDEGERYYAALWAFATAPIGLVEQLDRRLASITQIIDLQRLTGTTPDQTKRRVELAMKTIITDNNVDAWQRVRLALLALSLHDAEEAASALEQLAAQHPSEQVKLSATQLLQSKQLP